MNFKTVLTGFLSASALLGVISLSSVNFDVNSRNATSPESTDLTVRNATGSSVTTQDFPLITLSKHDNDFAVRNGTRSSVNPDIRFGTRDSRLST
ncbi:hypothetical protein [Bacillus safensis]|uniref:hypothetical protein n=1 Tax=Bacillus safensis TaxID=561879 RepID=UPI000BA747FB|nr:hypothetical protein [Bacillus safensis]MBG9816829.1 hypothetical protein [Bacillus safensis]OYN66587.1 hypothetical protein CFH85_06530 [Bacillus safensis]UQZ92610.1 hypothetical protein EI692_06385 [Bacillus safensis]